MLKKDQWRLLMMKIPEVAVMLGLSPWTVWRMVLDGRLPSHKIGRSRRVAESDVQRLMEKSRQEGGRALGAGVPSYRPAAKAEGSDAA